MLRTVLTEQKRLRGLSRCQGAVGHAAICPNRRVLAVRVLWRDDQRARGTGAWVMSCWTRGTHDQLVEVWLHRAEAQAVQEKTVPTAQPGASSASRHGGPGSRRTPDSRHGRPGEQEGRRRGGRPDCEEEEQGLWETGKATVRPRRTRTRQGGDSGGGEGP